MPMDRGRHVPHHLGTYPDILLADDSSVIRDADRKITATDADSVRLARRWLAWDWFNVAIIAAGSIAFVRAMTLPALPLR